MRSDAFSAIISVAALVFADTMVGPAWFGRAA
jgi:hypothetical protein